MRLSQNQLNYDQIYFLDLNGDGDDEEINLKSYKDKNDNFIVDLYINEKLKETYKDANYISVHMYDFNKIDKHKEICVILGNNIEKIKTNIFIYYDEYETKNYIINGRIINNDDKNKMVKITYGSTYNSLNFKHYRKVIGEDYIIVDYIYIKG